jgi:CheY-like chemotaxis protein
MKIGCPLFSFSESFFGEIRLRFKIRISVDFCTHFIFFFLDFFLFLKYNYKFFAMINILLADDDKDDRFFFERALNDLPVFVQVKNVKDGEQLIQYLESNVSRLPDVLFLDLNMPRKNGSECLAEIKSHKQLKNLPVVIYSTALNETVVDILYKKGAHFYIRKCELPELKKILNEILPAIADKKIRRPSRDEFVLGMIAV